jgi:FKBP-type peptidyl-prolyl cis-trans isomerase FkpA/FKBP-type peptidyl-prolyl cis-trans isomerase FklB
MRLRRTLAPVAAMAAALACTQGESGPLTTLQDSASYAVGQNMGGSIREVRGEIDLDQVMQGIRDAAEGRDGRLTPQEAQRVLMAYGQEVQERQATRRAAEADSNTTAGEAYRAENAKRAGVTTTPSGLQYEVLTAGTGPRPTATSTVQVHYVGTLIDGKEFDNSRAGGEPVTFALNEVIPGWSEAVQLMPVGGKYRFVIAPEIGYGPAGSPPDIGPNATLIFEVELLNIVQ